MDASVFSAIMLVFVLSMILAAFAHERRRTSQLSDRLDALSNRGPNTEQRLGVVQDMLLQQIEYLDEQKRQLEQHNQLLMQRSSDIAWRNEELLYGIRRLVAQIEDCCHETPRWTPRSVQNTEFASILLDEEQDALQDRLMLWTQNLNKLLERKARLGGELDIALENNIATHKQEISRLRDVLGLATDE